MSFPIRAGVGLCLLLLLVISRSVLAAPVFINEFHYDNSGGDTGEFIELAGVSGTLLDGWGLTLYNGNGGAAYDTLALSGMLADDTGTGFGFFVLDVPGLQNGSPDGIALADASGNLIEFLSYEGSFTASGGVADGVISTDVGVSEPSNNPVGWSLQLAGSGSAVADFSWQNPQLATPGAINTGQALLAVGAANPLPLPSAMLLLLVGIAAMTARSARLS